jgi:hypothetical protein
MLSRGGSAPAVSDGIGDLSGGAHQLDNQAGAVHLSALRQVCFPVSRWVIGFSVAAPFCVYWSAQDFRSGWLLLTVVSSTGSDRVSEVTIRFSSFSSTQLWRGLDETAGTNRGFSASRRACSSVSCRACSLDEVVADAVQVGEAFQDY